MKKKVVLEFEVDLDGAAAEEGVEANEEGLLQVRRALIDEGHLTEEDDTVGWDQVAEAMVLQNLRDEVYYEDWVRFVGTSYEDVP